MAQLLVVRPLRTTMKHARKLLYVVLGIVVLFIVIRVVSIARPPDDGRTPAERRQIVDACFVMLHSSLTNEVDDIKPDDLRVPEIIRALHPHHIEIIPDFAVNIYRDGKPEEYFLMRLHQHSATWILCVAGPSVSSGGGREILRIEHD